MTASAAVLAEITARIAHAGQTDKAGRAYIRHVEEVAAGVSREDDVTRVAAWLHDVVEDTRETLAHLMVVGGENLPDDDQLHTWAHALLLVEALTHRKGEPRSEYHARIREAGSRAVAVKLADVASNTRPERMARLDDETRDRLRDKYAQTVREVSES